MMLALTNIKNHTLGVLLRYNNHWTSKVGGLMVRGGTNTPGKKTLKNPKMAG